MDSTVVNRSIRAEIWPLLKQSGFTANSSRTAWRIHADRIDVISFQSFNSYNAGVLNITTFSFAVNLGCFLRYIPDQYCSTQAAARPSAEAPRPRESECHMRARLTRSYSDLRCKDRTIWYIDRRGLNVEKAVHDARVRIGRDALPWFERFESPMKVVAILKDSEEDMRRLWGFGQPGSPIRHYYLGYAARAAGQAGEARRNLLIAAATESFEGIAERLRKDAERTRL
jgi:hypothetical protein